jgi:dipeptidyl aminopeptidase/acylaminoacyl peptidase
MFWFYPREFTDQKSYDQRANQTVRMQTRSFRFERPSTRSMAMLTQLGYVVVEPDMPIVGETGRMNDNFVTDLRNGLWAVIDELDKRNLVDRDRLAIGGHSYGAFGTANALAHTPFFKAGIAGDGCYNRTLTPMSFQAERRYYWDARETYQSMSPLFYANQVNGALLMYHGAEDANTGTFPINSERMFQALDGLGKPTSMYMYPYEAHGPAAGETILDMWARWVAWLDHYVKNPQPVAPQAQPAAENGSTAQTDSDR